MSTRTLVFTLVSLSLMLLLAGSGFSPRALGADTPKVNPVTAGEFIVDPPTLINLGFEWMIQGDDNRNAKVEVSYRKKGDAQWKAALPLMRFQNEEIYEEDRLDLISPNMFAGSILDLEPGTGYEARFVMSDPDGVRKEALPV